MFSKDDFVPHEDELIVSSVSNERTPNRCACSHRNIYHVWHDNQIHRVPIDSIITEIKWDISRIINSYLL